MILLPLLPLIYLNEYLTHVLNRRELISSGKWLGGHSLCSVKSTIARRVLRQSASSAALAALARLGQTGGGAEEVIRVRFFRRFRCGGRERRARVHRRPRRFRRSARPSARARPAAEDRSRPHFCP